MKTKVCYILMTIIVIGMVMPIFASSPDKIKEDKTKTENPTPAPLAPTTWILHIVANDPGGQCICPNNCNAGWEIHRASDDCHAIASPSVFVSFVCNQTDYYQAIPDSINCVVVIINPGGCPASTFNTNVCCKCRGDNTPCKLKICP
jgi:hypothetical protein